MSTATETRPLHRSAPEWKLTTGDLAAETGADLGLAPDAEQRWLLDAIYAENDEGLPAAPEVCVVGPRQNLKSAVLEVAALHDLYVVGVDLAVWTAHEFKTARKSFEDMRRRILANPDYANRTDFRDSHGEEAIFLDTGERLEFHARSGGSGRGFTCKRLTLDEWMYGQEGDLGALGPTLFTIPDAQVRYASSAGKLKSSALRQLRSRGRVGDGSLAYAEYGAPRKDCTDPMCFHAVDTPGCALDDRDLWWQANCALWAGRATLESVKKQRDMLSAREFMREFLSWWEDPPNEAGGAIDLARWATLADPSAVRGNSLVWGVDVDVDRTASIVVAWTFDGSVHAELGSDIVPSHRVVERLTDLTGKWGGTVAAPTALLEDLTRAGLTVTEVKSSAWPVACANVVDRVTAGTLRHGNQPLLNEAAAAVRWGPTTTAGVRSFQLRDAYGAGPMFALTRALHGLNEGPFLRGWVMSV